MSKAKIKKNDQVLVIAGKDRGARGRVMRVLRDRNMALVERVNLVKRHTRPNPQRGIQGGILEKEAPLHLSNLMVIDPQKDKPTRVGRKRLEDGSSVRIAKKSGATLA
jgi:large subunit ribosomal protein L24